MNKIILLFLYFLTHTCTPYLRPVPSKLKTTFVCIFLLLGLFVLFRCSAVSIVCLFVCLGSGHTFHERTHHVIIISN